MAVTYGAEEGRLAVGIDVVQSPATVTKDTTAVTLTWIVYAKATYAFNDPQKMTLSNALSATKDYTMVSENGTTTVKEVGRWSQTVATSFTGTVSKTLVASASGLFNGGTPAHSRTIVIAKRPPVAPSAPVSADVNMATGTTAAVTWVRPSNASSAGSIWTNVIVTRSVNGGAFAVVATLAGSATSWTDSGLVVNTSYAYNVYAQNTGGNSAAVSAGSVQTSLAVPTAITPAAAQVITVPNPVLGGTMAAIAGGGTQRMQWQLASDSAFTTNVKTITEPVTDARTSGATTDSPSMTDLSLSSGTWWIRGRVLTTAGTYGPYSTGQSFTVNLPALTAPTAITPASGASVTTTGPTLGATLSADTAGRLVKAEWILATDVGFTSNITVVTESDLDFRASGATTETTPWGTITPALGTTWYIKARKVGSDGTASPWSAATSFTLSLTAPPVPTNITPIAGSTATSNTPTLGATLGQATEGRTVKAQWQLATNTAFTANAVSITESDTDLRTSGDTTEVIPPASKLFQGTWYIRARQMDQYGTLGAYSGYTSFTVAHAPTATPNTPAANATVLFGALNRLTWVFGDPSGTDTQTAYQVIVERNDTGAQVLDTGKVISTSNFADVDINASFKDITLRWRVRVWDNDNVAGNYSANRLLTLSDVPTVTITAPTNNQQLTTGQPTITWTTDANTVQASRRVVIARTSDGAVVFDSGTANTASKTFTPSTSILQNNVTYVATVTVTDTVGLTGSSTRNFSTAYQSPDTVMLSVDESTYDEEGYVMVDWSATTPDAFFMDWRVYRRPVMATEWELINVNNDPTDTYFRDWTATSGDTLEYAVTQTAGRSGAILESPIAYTETRIVEGSHYWLINPVDERDNLRLSNVVDDSYTDEYEEAALVIIGRGRKVNHGTRLGYAGTMTAQLRDDSLGSARAKRIQLQKLKDARTSYYLRNPFGDLIQVSLGNLGISRIAGVGTAEFVDVTIPYSEVF